MKTKKYYTNEEIENMSVDELKNLVQNQQIQLEEFRWYMNETKELLIAALQSMPKMIKI